MASYNIKIIMSCLLIMVTFCQVAAPPAMSVTGPVNTTGIAPFGSVMEVYASSANAFINYDQSLLSATYIFPGDLAANSTKIFTNMMNVFNNFLFQYANNSEPFMGNFVNQIFSTASLAFNVTNQNILNYTQLSNTTYRTYLSSTNRNATLNVANTVNSIVANYSSVNNLTQVTALGVQRVQNSMNNWANYQTWAYNFILNQTQVMNNINANQINDFSVMNNLQISNVQNYEKNVTFVLLQGNNTLNTSNISENATWNGSWANGLALYSFPATCGADGFGINLNFSILANNTFSAVQNAMQNFSNVTTANYLSNFAQIQLLDGNVTAFSNVTNLLKALSLPAGSQNITSSTVANIASSTVANNASMVTQMIWNNTFQFLRSLTNNSFPLNPLPVQGPALPGPPQINVTAQFYQNITNALNQMNNSINQAIPRFGPNSVETYQMSQLVILLAALNANINATINVTRDTIANWPTWYNASIPFLTQAQPLTNISAYMSNWTAFIVQVGNLTQQIVNLQMYYGSMSSLANNILIVNPQSTATLFVPSPFIAAFNSLQNTIFGTLNPLLNQTMAIQNSITNFYVNFGNYWQNLMVQQQTLKQQVLVATNNFTNYLSSVFQTQLLFEVAQAKAQNDVSSLALLQTAHTNWMNYVIGNAPTTFTALTLSSSYLNFRSNVFLVNKAFRQIDTCLIQATPTPCTSFTYYYAQDITKYNLTNAPSVWVSTFLSLNQTFVNGTDGTIASSPTANPILYNATTGVTPAPTITTSAPSNNNPSFAYVAIGPNYSQYVLALVSVTSTLLVFQLTTTAALNTFPALAMNVTIGVLPTSVSP